MRRLWSTEAETFRDHLKRLDPEARRLRFTGAISDIYLDRYAQEALAADGVTYGWFRDGALRAAAELRPLTPRIQDGIVVRDGEAAFSVERDWQGTGIGTALMRRVLQAARNRGLRRIIVTCLPENVRMQKVARKHDARIVFEDGDVVGLLTQPSPSGWSLWREAVQEGHGLVDRMFEGQRKAVGKAA
ncbi:MAG: GNAT family N-acetyltransferase [Pseudomonadota bacterium]